MTVDEPAPARDEEHQRTERVQVRMTPAERAEIERRAAAAHRPVSEYLRYCALTDRTS